MGGYLFRLVEFWWDNLSKCTRQKIVIERKVTPEEAAEIAAILDIGLSQDNGTASQDTSDGDGGKVP